MADLTEKAVLARKASIALARLDNKKKKGILLEIAEEIRKNKATIISENKKDIKDANVQKQIKKRLELTDEKIEDMISGIITVANLPDPIGETLESKELDKGLELYKVSVPLGVIGAIFEARPDAMVQIFSLCFKSGNASLLKGGSEALKTNMCLHKIMRGVMDKTVKDASILLETREDVNSMLKLDKYIDMIIPRGSSTFVRYIMDNTKIPVLGHSEGICHAYIDEHADKDMAKMLMIDAKCQYPAACNTVETLLVHKDIAPIVLPSICEALAKEGVELRGDKAAIKIYKMKEASEKDWDTEYGDLILSIKIVEDIKEAIDHINTHGSRHSDMIITDDERKARIFLQDVDSSSVMWNASTRFADGFRYGKGAETGISTGKVHARGPVGLEGLVIYKYILKGKGHIVKDYVGNNKFTHKRMDRIWQKQ